MIEEQNSETTIFSCAMCRVSPYLKLFVKLLSENRMVHSQPSQSLKAKATGSHFIPEKISFFGFFKHDISLILPAHLIIPEMLSNNSHERVKIHEL